MTIKSIRHFFRRNAKRISEAVLYGFIADFAVFPFNQRQMLKLMTRFALYKLFIFAQNKRHCS